MKWFFIWIMSFTVLQKWLPKYLAHVEFHNTICLFICLLLLSVRFRFYLLIVVLFVCLFMVWFSIRFATKNTFNENGKPIWMRIKETIFGVQWIYNIKTKISHSNILYDLFSLRVLFGTRKNKSQWFS